MPSNWPPNDPSESRDRHGDSSDLWRQCTPGDRNSSEPQCTSERAQGVERDHGHILWTRSIQTDQACRADNTYHRLVPAPLTVEAARPRLVMALQCELSTSIPNTSGCTTIQRRVHVT